MATTLLAKPTRYQLEVPILEHRRRGEYEYELVLLSPEVAQEARPGQFMQILSDDSYNPYSRRPFSVFWTDRTKEAFSIVYLARGVFTEGLRNKARPAAHAASGIPQRAGCLPVRLLGAPARR